MSENQSDQAPENVETKPQEVTLDEVESSQEDLDLAEMEEERRRLRNGLLFGVFGSGALVGVFYLLHEIFS